ncbi:tetratricopeptide repeat protein [Caviibacter abscessus]|uniref:tetratricopeptide repeat protein n=1 Tax=Caviibacter abscessus TaxID=1766719 RepID=UPI0008391016|nr:hypothetical protein [Caviibacter abscessus]
MGFFDFFKSNKKEEQIDKEEYLEIINEDGEPQKVKKNDWLQDFYKLVEKNLSNPDELYNLILLAFDYGIYTETMDACMQLYMVDENTQRKTNILCSYYSHNGLYKEAIELYETYIENGNKMTANMYYNLAMLQEKIGNMEEMEKNLFFALKEKQNFKKAINKYIEHMKNVKPQDYYLYIEELASNGNSWYLKKEVAKILYSINQNEKATNYLIQALLVTNREDIILEIANILMSNDRNIEYDNYVLPKYDLRNASMSFHLSVLNFYLKDKQYENGFKLLLELFNNDIYDESFSEYELKYILLKFEKEQKEKHSAYINNKKVGNDKIKLLYNSIDNLIFETEKIEKEGSQILILPFILGKSSKNVPEGVKVFAKTISSYIFESMYISSNGNIKSLLVYDDLGIVQYTQDYPIKYFEAIKSKNPDLDYIVSGVIHDIKEDGTFILSVYKYDLNEKTKTNIYDTNVNCETTHRVLDKLINLCMKESFAINMPEISITQENVLSYYNIIIDLVLNINKDNANKLFQTKKVIDYLISEIEQKNQVTVNINLLLLVLYIQKSNFPQLKMKYNNKIYNILIENNCNSEIMKKFEMIYGE